MTAEELVARVEDLPSLPQASARLMYLLGDNRRSNEDIVQVVQRDLVLTAKLLRWCNSAALGAREPVASVEEAVFRLGHALILKAVMAVHVAGPLQRSLPGYGIQESDLWRHSLGTALAAELVIGAVFPDLSDTATAFTAGLLHDFGKVVLNRVLTDELQSRLRRHVADESVSWADAERAVLGTDHSEVGACLLTRWQIPDVIVQAVAHHHRPEAGSPAGLSVVVHLADCAAHRTGCSAGRNDYTGQAHGDIARQMGMDAGALERLLAEVDGSMEVIQPFMELN